MNIRTSRVLAFALITALAISAAGCRDAGVPEPSPNTPSSTELVEEPARFDGEEVTFSGEVIGEAMSRGAWTWLHVNDDAYYRRNVEEGAELGGYNTGMPVWVASDDAAGITYFGDYEHEGDIIVVEGVFNAACAEHGGDTDIHANSLAVRETGHTVVDPVHAEKVQWAAVLALIALALYLLDRNWDALTESRKR